MKIRLYMNGVKTNPDGSDADYVDIEDDNEDALLDAKHALFAMGWKESEFATLPN